MGRAAEWRLVERTGTLFAQLFFIAAGVYLGNQADAWKEERSHRDAARAALSNLRAEIAHNRDSVTSRLSYHRALAASIAADRRRGGPPPATVREALRRVEFSGLQVVNFRRTAWNLSLATQALSYIPAPLAFRVADAYAEQDFVAQLQANAFQNLISPSALDDARAAQFVFAVDAYLSDINQAEPALVRAYTAVLPAVDSALAAAPR